MKFRGFKVKDYSNFDLSIRRVKRTETRTVNGVTFEVRFLQQMSYAAEWEHDGYYVYLNGKIVYDFYSWPTDDDLEDLKEFLDAQPKSE